MTKDEPKEEKESFVPSLLWALLVLVMWFWAVVGPLTAAAGVASSFADLRGFLAIPPRQAVGLGSALGAVGVTFVWLRIRGYIKFRGE